MRCAAEVGIPAPDPRPLAVGFAGVLGRAIRLAILIGILVPASASAGIRATVVGNFDTPTYIAAPPGDTHRLFVVEQSGVIELIKDGGAPTPFLNISSQVTFAGGEQGLLSMAFSPDYATSRRFYVYYTSKTCEVRAGVTSTSTSSPPTPTATQPTLSPSRCCSRSHTRTRATTTAASSSSAPTAICTSRWATVAAATTARATPSTWTGCSGRSCASRPRPAAIRSPPAGNPFSSGQSECSSGPHPGTECPEIWAYGLRNPWRFSFDSATGDMVIADVGQSAEEEIDFAHPGQNVGANYGWPCYEGLIRDAAAPSSECSPLPSPVVFPVQTYPHPQNCNGAPFCGDGIIGGYVMHDPTLPSIDGCYVYGDLGTAGLRMVSLGQPSAAASVALGPQIDSLSTFGLDASSHLYAADIGSGDVYRIESDGNPATDPRCAPPPPPPPPSPPVVTVQPTLLNPPGGVTLPAPGLSALRITRAGTVTFRLNQPATITFTVQRAHPGRETGSRCRRDSGAHPKARRCVIWSAVPGHFRVKGNRGSNRFTFTWRIGGRTLGPGDYRLVAHAGNGGKPVHVRFSIPPRLGQ